MGDVGGSLGMQRALVPVAERSRPAALYRIPVTLMLLGLFTMALQAGQPLLGLAMLMTAVTTTLGFAWRAGNRQGTEVSKLRSEGDARLADGRYGEARALYERSLALAERELPPAAPEVLLNYYSLAAVSSMMHDHARAGRYLEELMQGLGDRVPAPWSGHVAWLMRRVAHHHSQQGEHAEADRLCRRALDLVGDAPGADDNPVRSLLDDLAWIQHHAGQYVEAERLFREVLAIHEQFRDLTLELAQRPRRGRARAARPIASRARPPSPPRGARPRGGLQPAGPGLDDLRARSLRRGSPLLRSRGADRPAPVHGRGRGRPQRGAPRAVGGGLEGRAAVAVTLGDYGLAEACYQEAQRQLVVETDEVSQRVALLVDMGWLARCRERYEQAEALGSEAQALVEQGGGMPSVASALHESLAELRRRQGRAREGQRHIEIALSTAERCLGAEHPRVASILAVAARLHVARSELHEAERLARRSLSLVETSLGAEHPRSAEAYLALGEVQLARGQVGAAERSTSLALARRQRALGPEHPELGEILDAQVAVLRASAREDEVGPLLERRARLRERLDAPRAGTAASDSIADQP